MTQLHTHMNASGTPDGAGTPRNIGIPDGAGTPDGASTQTALAVSDVTLAWGDGKIVASQLSFSVATGEIVCMLGQSGTGKTTLLHALAGLTHPQAGTLTVASQPSYMLQTDALLEHLSVRDNACLPLILKGIPKQEAYEQVKTLVKEFGIDGLEERWPAELSGGQRQRVAFLRTYMMNAPIILLDEPFSALDAITRRELRTWFARMARKHGLSVLMITHDVDEALLIGDRVLVLSGAPAHGVPSHIAGEVRLERDGAESLADFELSQTFIDAKRELLELLSA